MSGVNNRQNQTIQDQWVIDTQNAQEANLTGNSEPINEISLSDNFDAQSASLTTLTQTARDVIRSLSSGTFQLFGPLELIVETYMHRVFPITQLSSLEQPNTIRRALAQIEQAFAEMGEHPHLDIMSDEALREEITQQLSDIYRSVTGEAPASGLIEGVLQAHQDHIRTFLEDIFKSRMMTSGLGETNVTPRMIDRHEKRLAEAVLELPVKMGRPNLFLSSSGESMSHDPQVITSRIVTIFHQYEASLSTSYRPETASRAVHLLQQQLTQLYQEITETSPHPEVILRMMAGERPSVEKFISDMLEAPSNNPENVASLTNAIEIELRHLSQYGNAIALYSSEKLKEIAKKEASVLPSRVSASSSEATQPSATVQSSEAVQPFEDFQLREAFVAYDQFKANPNEENYQKMTALLYRLMNPDSQVESLNPKHPDFARWLLATLSPEHEKAAIDKFPALSRYGAIISNILSDKTPYGKGKRTIQTFYRKDFNAWASSEMDAIEAALKSDPQQALNRLKRFSFVLYTGNAQQDAIRGVQSRIPASEAALLYLDKNRNVESENIHFSAEDRANGFFAALVFHPQIAQTYVNAHSPLWLDEKTLFRFGASLSRLLQNQEIVAQETQGQLPQDAEGILRFLISINEQQFPAQSLSTLIALRVLEAEYGHRITHDPLGLPLWHPLLLRIQQLHGTPELEDAALHYLVQGYQKASGAQSFSEALVTLSRRQGAAALEAKGIFESNWYALLADKGLSKKLQNYAKKMIQADLQLSRALQSAEADATFKKNLAAFSAYTDKICHLAGVDAQSYWLALAYGDQSYVQSLAHIFEGSEIGNPLEAYFNDPNAQLMAASQVNLDLLSSNERNELTSRVFNAVLNTGENVEFHLNVLDQFFGTRFRNSDEFLVYTTSTKVNKLERAHPAITKALQGIEGLELLERLRLARLERAAVLLRSTESAEKLLQGFTNFIELLIALKSFDNATPAMREAILTRLSQGGSWHTLLPTEHPLTAQILEHAGQLGSFDPNLQAVALEMLSPKLNLEGNAPVLPASMPKLGLNK